MEKQVLAKDQFLAELNAELEKKQGYEQGMWFTGIGRGGFHLLDPRYLALHRGQREHDFSDEPFAEAISAVSARFDLDRTTIGDAL